MTDPRIEAAAEAIEAVTYSDVTGALAEECATAALAAADKAATVTTVEGLEALPDGTVLRDHWGNVAELAVYDLGSEKPVRTWHRTDGTEDESVLLPATIIHRGTA